MAKRVSLEEYLDAKGAGGLSRKHFARDDGVVIKAAPAGLVKAASFDKEAGTCRFVMSAEIEDRDRDIVVQAGLNTDQFEKNPVALWAHSSRDPIGSWSDVQKTLTGRPKRTEGTLGLTMEDPTAAKVAAHLGAGSLRACSIGFMPTALEKRDVPDDGKGDYYYPGYMILEADLYECSVCSIPANPAALAKAAADGNVLPRELLEQVFDTWTKHNDLIIPRAEYEAMMRQGQPEKSIVVIDGKRFKSEPAEGDFGRLLLTPAEPTEAEKLADAIEADESVLNRFLKALGLKAKTSEADPAPQQDGPKPAPEPVQVPKTAEEELREQFAADLPAILAKHEIIEADARFAALDAEMQQHAAA